MSNRCSYCQTQTETADLGAALPHSRAHPAVVAGRVRHERGNDRLLSQLVGSGKVRRQFAPGKGSLEERN